MQLKKNISTLQDLLALSQSVPRTYLVESRVSTLGSTI